MVGSEWLRVARELLAPEPVYRFGLDGWVGRCVFALGASALDTTISASSEIESTVEFFNAYGADGSLHLGVSGLGLVLALQGGGEFDDVLAQIDEVLGAQVGSWGDFGLRSGLAGAALYASTRSHERSGRLLQEDVCKRLKAMASPTRDGILWYASPESFEHRHGRAMTEAVIEPGMAHGVGGVLVALAALAGAESEQAKELLHSALLGVSAWHADTDARSQGSLSNTWCVGELGLLRALSIASQACGERALGQRALAAARESARALIEGSGAGRASRMDLCCGSAGLFLILYRFSLETGEAVFADAWQQIASWSEADISRIAPSSFMWGRQGVVLTAATLTNLADPFWDCTLGLSLPTARKT